MITIAAPAKINLTLEVLGKRADGFHEVRSVMQTINLCDRLTFQMGRGLEFKCDSPGWIAEKSLVSKAARLLQETTGCSLGAVITVEKHIPLVGGLGGDSSDAAAVLPGLDRLWKLGLPKGKLLDLVHRLGSDVAFFLYGGTAMVKGRGEIVKPLPPLPRSWVVLVIPDIPRPPEKTKLLYGSLTTGHYTHGEVTRRMAARLRDGGELPSELLFNVFEGIAFDIFPGLSVYRERIREAGVSHVHLAGSGPTLFILFKDEAGAEKLSRRFKANKMEVYLAETLTPNEIYKL